MKPFHLVKAFFLHPYQDNDSFSQRCRKNVLTATLVIWIVASAQWLLWIPQFEKDAAKASVVNNDTIVLVLTVPIFYALMWHKRHVSDTMAMFWISSLFLVLLIQVILDATASTNVYAPIIMVAGLVGQIPYCLRWCAVGVALIGLSYYNLLSVTEGNTSTYQPLMLSPEWSYHSTCNHFGESSFVFRLCVCAAMSWMIYAQTSAFNHQIAVARQNADVAHEIAELLGMYKTKEAAVVLQDRGSGCDTALVENLNVIVKNMDSYRPYLPNYLLPSIEEEQLEKSMASSSMRSDDETTSTHSSLKPPSPKKRSSMNVGGGEESDPLTSSLLNAASNVSSSFEGTFHSRSVTLAVFSFRDLYRWESSQQQGMGQRTEPSSLRSTVSHFIEAVHTHTTDQRGVVHGFLGDEVTLTWNALTKCVDHCFRGAATLMELTRSHEHDFDGSGAIVSGTVRCQRGGTNTFAWTLHAPLLFRRLRYVQGLSSKIGGGCVLTTGVVAEQIEHGAATQCIDVVVLDNNCNSSIDNIVDLESATAFTSLKKVQQNEHTIHEVLHVASGPSMDDEWMYQLQNQKEGGEETHVQVTECVNLALSGNILQAIAMLENVVIKAPKAQHSITGGVRHLMRRLVATSHNTESFPSAA